MTARRGGRLVAVTMTVISSLALVLLPVLPAQATESTAALDVESARAVILDETNAARAAAGLAPVRMTVRLNGIAQTWTETQARQNQMAHNPSYSSQYPPGWTRAAENVAAGYGIDRVVDAWLGSAGHRQNILNAGTNYIGIGVARSSSGRLYYTQNFATYPTTPTDVIGGSSSPEQDAATSDIAVGRLAGSDRYATSVRISSRFAPGVPVLYVASGNNFPDALAAAPAAAAQGGPLLLTTPTSLPSAVLAEVKRLQPKRIVVVGGPSVVATRVIEQLRAIQPDVRRDAGDDRYATAARIVERAFPSATRAYIATGANFPDALSGSAAAAAAGVPVILVPSSGSGSRLPASTAELLDRLGVQKVTILGSTGVVSDRIQTDLERLLGSSNVSRLGGGDRYATSSIVNRAAFSSTSPNEVFFATGAGYADALPGGALAGKGDSPLYLVPKGCVPAAVLKDLVSMGVTKVTLLGGTSVLSSTLSSLPSC